MAIPKSPTYRSSRVRGRQYVFESNGNAPASPCRAGYQSPTPKSCQTPSRSFRRRSRQQERRNRNDSFASSDSNGSAGFWGSSTQKLKVIFNEDIQVRYFDSSTSVMQSTKDECPLSPKSQAELDEVSSKNDEDLVNFEQQQRHLDFSYINILKHVIQQAPTDDSQDKEDSSRSISYSQASKICEWTEMVKESWSPRGLECYWDVDYNHDRRRARTQYTLAVLLLQARLGRDAFQSEETWKEVARQTRGMTQASHRRAHRQALLDQLDARYELGDGILGKVQAFKRT